MKVLIVGHEVSGFGGMETAVGALCGVLRRHKIEHRVVILQKPGTKMDLAWLKGVDFKVLRSRGLATWVKLAGMFMKFSPDICITIDEHAASEMRRLRTTLGRRCRIVSWFHFSLNHAVKPERILGADAHFCISRFNAEWLAQKGAKGRIYLLHNFVRLGEPLRSKERGRFLYLGRINFEQKNLQELLAGLEGLKKRSWTLDLIGSGPAEADIRQWAKSRGWEDRVRFHGWQADCWDYVKSIGGADFLCLTSRYEGFPYALLEALAHGIPCISSDCNGPLEIIQDGVNGYLYPQGDSTALASCLMRAVDGEDAFPIEQLVDSIGAFSPEVFERTLMKALTELEE